jgi:hypothetical protein
MRRFLVLILLLAPFTGVAQSVYRSVDEHGNVIFTDTPPADGSAADRIDLQRTNTVQATPPPPPPPRQETSQEEVAAALEYEVVITAPTNETSFPMGPGNFSVSVSVNPELEKYDGLQLFMDGTPWGSPQRDSMWDLTNVFRGQHDITVAVINSDGETLAMSPPVRVFVHRPSINFNRNKAPLKPPPKPK